MQNEPNRRRETTWMRLSVLAFGLLVLVFLAAIDRPHWFEVRPATGTAAALAAAADAPATDRRQGWVASK